MGHLIYEILNNSTAVYVFGGFVSSLLYYLLFTLCQKKGVMSMAGRFWGQLVFMEPSFCLSR